MEDNILKLHDFTSNLGTVLLNFDSELKKFQQDNAGQKGSVF